MSLVRLVARPMLASIFIVQGFKKLRTPDEVEAQAKPVTDRMTPLLERYAPQVPTDTRTLVRINGAIDLGAGLMLATGKFPRLASLVLAASLAPATASHTFWNTDDTAERAQQRTHFLKNVSLAGGLLIAGVDTAGRPGLRWRTEHTAARGRKAARAARRDARLSARAVRAEAAQKKTNLLHR